MDVLSPAGAPPETQVPLAARAEGMIIVAGGYGKHLAFVPTFGATRSVPRRIEALD